MRTILRLYRPLITGLLFLLMLIAARMIWHHSFQFLFLPWNILLAILPLCFAHCAAHARRPALKWTCAGFWLLFFPNSAYLLTDIVHLHIRAGTAFWLDLVLLFAAGMYGVILGLRSLRMMEGWYARMLSPRASAALTIGLLLLNGYGIYLGRIERWSSWDFVCNTGDLLSAIAYEVRHPFRCIAVWGLSGIFAAGLGLGYFALNRRLRW
jgi:uncharacterized membrane protein